MTFVKTIRMELLETKHNKPIEQIIRDAINNHETREEAAASLGISRQALHDWCRYLKLDDLIRGYYRNGDDPANCKEG